MTTFSVAYHPEDRVATILDKDGEVPEGASIIGQINATAISPNPTDVSTQHIHNLLYRSGVNRPDQVRVNRQPLDVTIEHKDETPAEDMQNQLSDGLPKQTDQDASNVFDLKVGDTIDLVDGSTRGYTFEVSDDDVLKLDKRNAKVTALKSGNATVTVDNTNDEIESRTVQINVTEVDETAEAA